MTSTPDGYFHFYEEGLFCDLELCVGTDTYHLHQLIVGNASNVIARAVEQIKYPNNKSASAEDQPISPDSGSPIPRQILIKAQRCGGEPWRGKVRCELAQDSYSSYWPELIEYMYTNNLKQLSTSSIVGWFSLATDLELATLKTELIDWIVSNITKDDLFDLLPIIIAEARASQFLRYAISLIARNFSDFVEADRYTRAHKSQLPVSPRGDPKTSSTSSKNTPKGNSAQNKTTIPSLTTAEGTKNFNFDWRVFPFHAMKDLLHDKNLFAASEEDVFEAIMHYLEKYDESTADAKELASLFESVRFERLEYATLEAALAHPLVPKELLSRALMARLAGFEKPTPSAPISAPAPAASTASSAATLSTSPTQQAHISRMALGANNSIQSSPKISPPNSRDPSSNTLTLGHPIAQKPENASTGPHTMSSSTTSANSQSTASSQFSSPHLPISATPPVPSVSVSSSASLAWPSSSPSQASNSPLSGAARDRRRQSYGRLFQWSSDFDKKGVLYYLGTREYRTEWQNPFLQKLVDVTWSSLEKGKAPAIFEREPSECWTQDVPSSWFTIDLGAGRSLRITAYTLRHGGGTKQDLIRNWTLKGSVDGKEFTTLMRHKDDESLSTAFATMTWTISGVSQAYRFFKVIQTGHNSSKHNFLSIGGVELYGELIYDMSSVQKIGAISITSATTSSSI